MDEFKEYIKKEKKRIREEIKKLKKVRDANKEAVKNYNQKIDQLKALIDDMDAQVPDND